LALEKRKSRAMKGVIVDESGTRDETEE